MAGVTLHYLLTGDSASLTAIGRVADVFSAPYYALNFQDLTAEMDNRIQARALTAYLYAWKNQCAPHEWHELATLLRASLTRILASQAPNDLIRLRVSNAAQNKNFMTGLLNDALIEYYTLFEADARIQPAIQKSLDLYVTSSWDTNGKAFRYLSGPCATDPEAALVAPI